MGWRGQGPTLQVEIVEATPVFVGVRVRARVGQSYASEWQTERHASAVAEGSRILAAVAALSWAEGRRRAQERLRDGR